MDDFSRGPVTREELILLLDVHNKTAQQLEKIANSLTVIIDSQNRTNLKLYNGMANDIVDRLLSSIGKCFGAREEEHEKISQDIKDVKEDTFWIKIIFGSIAAITAITVAIMQLSHWITHAPRFGG